MTASGNRGWFPLAVLSVGAFAAVLNSTQLSPLLKPIATDLGVSEGTAGQLATTSAIVGTIAALLVAPWMDRIPRSRWLQGQAAILIAATIFSALAPSFAWLVVARVAATYVSNNALLLDAIPPARGTVMALGGASIGAGSAVGAFIGGGALAVFGDYADVYHLLGVLMPLGIVAIVMGTHVRVAAEPPPQTATA
jgi:predicted MFS family arabinose efflux permease